MLPSCTENTELLTRDFSRLPRVNDNEEHLSGRNDKFKMLAAAETSSNIVCRPSRVRLISTKSSAYART